jgi:hypothetical protein
MCVRRENHCCHREDDFREWWTKHVGDEFVIFQVQHLAIALRKAEANCMVESSKQKSSNMSVWCLLLLLLMLLLLTLIVRLGWYRG